MDRKADYLLGITDTKKAADADLSMLKLDDEKMVVMRFLRRSKNFKEKVV